ncbi:hypothetical protein GCM10022393_07740 [Aquimarina addita]|uniref:Toxin-antitoxin system YwqK family antitoxin n=1 Tax=Aquimarina addita TaxID=870485 RepID=A0ABP7XE07_9FLAO
MKNGLKISVLLLGIIFFGCVHNKEELKVEYYETGDVKAIGTLKDTKRVGVWAFYDELGTRVDSIVYQNGKKNGWLRGYDLRIRQLDKEGQYKDDKETGVWKTYHAGGTVHTIETFEKGNKIGESVYYYAGGNPKISILYNNQGQKHGLTTEYYTNGLVAVTGQYEQDVPSGTWKEYYENNKLKESYSYQSGLWHGVYEKYHANGLLATKGMYNQDTRTGIWKYYDEKGNELDNEIIEE